MRRNWIWSAVGLAILGAGSFAAYLILQPKPLPESLVYGNGHIEGTEIRVAAEVAGRVERSELLKGSEVKQGDVVARVASDDFTLRLRQREAEAAAIQQSIAALETQLDTMRHHAGTAAADLKRAEDLANRGNLSQQRLDQATNADKEARGQVVSLKAKLNAARASLDATSQSVALAQRNLERATITAPASGTVTARLVEDGEVVAAGQTLGIIVDLSRVELKVYIVESDLAKIRIGAPARVTVDAFPNRTFDAVVKVVDSQAQFTPRDIHMQDERARTVFGVTLGIAQSPAGLHPGIPADAWILWQEGATWPAKLHVPR